MRIHTKNKSLPAKLKTQKPLPEPTWLKIRPPTTDKFAAIKTLLKDKKLNTVCSEANCPNVTECWSGGTATFMVLGDTCTRACRFCNVKSGNPHKKIDQNEPKHLVEAVKIMKLKYVVITCVTRDDLPDGGAGHFASCIKALKEAHLNLKIELLISDLDGNLEALKTIIAAKPDVLGHNLETVERLQSKVRDPRANYKKSLTILKEAKNIAATIGRDPQSKNPLYTKTSLMVGLGEKEEEIERTIKDARAVDVDFITFGQYLRPSPFHLPIHEYTSPKKFKHYETLAKKHGFRYCASAPFVRSSYKAGEYFLKK